MRYFELAIEGPVDEVKGFCLGTKAVCCTDAALIFSQEEGIERYGLSDLIKKFVFASKMVSHVICDERIKDDLISAFETDGTYKVKEVAQVESASFKFKVEAYSREHADRIKELLKKQSGVKLTLGKVEEEKRPEDKGVEVYAPAHDYKYAVKGKVSGSFDEVYEVFTKFKKEPLIEVTTMKLEVKGGST